MQGIERLGQSTAPDGTFTALAAGGNHTCGLHPDDTATCWGRSELGQATAPAGTFTALTRRSASPRSPPPSGALPRQSGVKMNDQDLIKRLARLEAEVVQLREERVPGVDRSSRRRDRRLGGAFMLMAVVALGLAAVGSASALDGSNTVFNDDIVDGAVTSTKILDGAVRGIDVKDGTLTTTDIYDGTVRSADVKDETLTGSDIADGTVGGADIADGTLNSADVANGSLTGEDINLFNDNQCNGETVQGTAVVNADAAVPASFTTNWLGWQHSCSGEPVQVRRDFVGRYQVNFGSSNPARLAVATVADANALSNTTIRVRNIAAGWFQVELWSAYDAGPRLVDADFTILAY